MEFTYDSYANLVSKLRKHDYQFASYHNYKALEKCVIMRHDIDYSLQKSVELAEFEKQLGIQSTYFILLSSPFYNIMSKDAVKKIKKIQNAGHEIGLHFDELNYDEYEYDKIGGVEKAIYREIDLMRSILDCDIKSVSMHRPSQKTLQANYDLGIIVNSYSSDFFERFKYVSDSRRRWRENVDEIISCELYNKLHILTHAFWYNKTEATLEATIKNFIAKAGLERYEILESNISDLQSILKKDDVI